MFGWHKTRPSALDLVTDLRCSFCKREQAEVDHLIAGPSVWICDACVFVCLDILNQEAHSDRSRPGVGDSRVEPHVSPEANRPRWHSLARCRLCGMPMNPDDGVTVTDVGLLCRPCVTRIRASIEPRSKAAGASTNE